MPIARVFIDSGTLLYTLDRTAPVKRERALEWLEGLAAVDGGVTNLQALNETASVLTRKVRRFPDLDVAAQVDVFSAFGRSPVTWRTVLQTRRLRARVNYSWWDSLLLASAVELGCTHFLSEDLKDGHAVDGLTIIDPFAHSPADILSR